MFRVFWFSFLFSLLLILVACAPTEQKSKPTKDEPIVEQPSETELVDPEPVEPEPVEPEPVEPEPVEPEPVEPEPVEPEPVEPEPVEAEAVKPRPVKPEPMQVGTHTLRGSVVLDQSKLKRKNAVVENTVVYFVPDSLVSKPVPMKAEISTQNKRFKPNVLAVTVGSEVLFPNMDRILHNVFSVTPASEFDLGLYSAGTTRSVTFNEPGIIYVHCNVHHAMQADLLVLDTPHFVQVDDQGRFELSNLPSTAGTLNFWHPRAPLVNLRVDADTDGEVQKQTIQVTRVKVPKHTNKFGESYRPTRD